MVQGYLHQWQTRCHQVFSPPPDSSEWFGRDQWQVHYRWCPQQILPPEPSESYRRKKERMKTIFKQLLLHVLHFSRVIGYDCEWEVWVNFVVDHSGGGDDASGAVDGEWVHVIQQRVVHVSKGTFVSVFSQNLTKQERNDGNNYRTLKKVSTLVTKVPAGSLSVTLAA